MLPEEDKARALPTIKVHKILVKLGRAVLEICEWTDRHTHYSTL